MTEVFKNYPDFAGFDAATVVSALENLLANHRERLGLIESAPSPDWNTVMAPLEAMGEELSNFWSPVRHLNSVLNNDEIREAYNSGRAMISAWYTDLGQNKTLYAHTQAIRQNEGFASLEQAQQKVIENALRDFELSGVGLEGKAKARYKEIELRLTELNSRFEENLLDCTNAWKKPIDDRSQLAGLPESALAMAAQYARDNNGESGWMLGLEFPLYYAVMTYADDRDLRREVYTAFNTRASDQGPHDQKYRNDAIIEEILDLRAEKAKLLGFANYATLSTETKMVESPAQVVEFLESLTQKSKSFAEAEYQQLVDFARATAGHDDLQAWDIAYFSEKQRQADFDISDEDLKPYFPADRAVEGLFAVVNRLYGIEIEENAEIATWHDDVRYFEISDTDGELRGGFYLDMYARANKRGGAWMDECVTRWRSSNGVHMPIAYLTCNLTPPTDELPSLLTHDEVITLFHEFGHGLHHMLTKVDYPAIAGINGVEWDAVELPSQFLENWCWQRESLDLISSHYQSGKKIPDELLAKAQKARNFQSAMQMMRQIEFALFDMRLHMTDESEKIDVQAVLDSVREQVAVIKPPAFNRFQNSFSHIFAGGYAAGYFSYKWAEVLSSDAFSRFEEEGIFNNKTGAEFMQSVLERGGTQPARELFIEFRGREPSIEPLLRHSGLAA
ncbi:MAG: M3 family metallopeptidase [Pseudomonadota bacterium]